MNKIIIKKEMALNPKPILESKLKYNTQIHKTNVFNVMTRLVTNKLIDQAATHDDSKLATLKEFTEFANNGFEGDWFEKHMSTERHHCQVGENVPLDVNLFDIVECIVDCVCASKARGSNWRSMNISEETLVSALNNTIDLILQNVECEE